MNVANASFSHFIYYITCILYIPICPAYWIFGFLDIPIFASILKVA
jgi:hypothetical protein